jgi:transcriptional regulator with XRE-family HTH domain
MKLSLTLTSLCKKQKLTLAELSRRSGIPKQTLHNWTLGRRLVNPDQLKKAADALKVSVHYLLYGEQDPHDSPSEEIMREIFSGDVRVTLHRIERKRK